MTRYNGYRSGTIRHDDWEYRRAGWYFVTVCTGDRRPFLGRVRNGVVGLSAAGCIAAREWQRTPVVRPYVRLDVWIVMPGNVHGLIDITTDSPACSGDTPPGHPNVDSSRRDESTESLDAKSADEFRLRAHSLGAIIGRYKSVCTKQIRGGRTARIRMTIPVLRPNHSRCRGLPGRPAVHSGPPRQISSAERRRRIRPSFMRLA
jgi:hypothetical protein